MESTGEPGCVHLSDDAWRLTGLPDALAASRTLAIKGKEAAMRTHLLDSASPAAAEAARLLEPKLEGRGARGGDE